jgi:hypothetical protein
MIQSLEGRFAMGPANYVLKGLLPGVLIGVGATLAAPILLPAAAARARPVAKVLVLAGLAAITGARPVAKVLIGSGLAMADAVREAMAEAGKQLSDLVAEVQAERARVAAAAAEQLPEGRPAGMATPHEA